VVAEEALVAEEVVEEIGIGEEVVEVGEVEEVKEVVQVVQLLNKG
jgi:hypothetical protein